MIPAIAYGLWPMAYGLWLMDYGLWIMAKIILVAKGIVPAWAALMLRLTKFGIVL